MIPVPEMWEWIFFTPFPFPNFGNIFFYSLPFLNFGIFFPFLFLNTQKSFPLIPECYCQVLISTLNVQMVSRRSLQIKRLFLQPSQKEQVTRNGCNASRGPQCCWRNVTSIWSILDCKVQKMVEYMLPHQIPPGH